MSRSEIYCQGLYGTLLISYMSNHFMEKRILKYKDKIAV